MEKKRETKAASRKEDLPQGMGEGVGMACLLKKQIIIVRCLRGSGPLIG